MTVVPADVLALIGQPQFAQVSDGMVEAGAIRLFAAAVQDATPAYWADDPAQVVAPPALLSAWNRPAMWNPDGNVGTTGLALHHRIKDKLGLPRAIVTEMESEIAAPIRPGMKVRSEQILVELGEPCTTRLGDGRYWTIRVEYRDHADGALLGAETLRLFGYGEVGLA